MDSGFTSAIAQVHELFIFATVQVLADVFARASSAATFWPGRTTPNSCESSIRLAPPEGPTPINSRCADSGAASESSTSPLEQPLSATDTATSANAAAGSAT